MKKLLLTIPIVMLLAAGCNYDQQTYSQPSAVYNTSTTTTPPAISTKPAPNSLITKQQAIEIASKDIGAHASNYDVNAYLQNDNWYVNFSPKQPPCSSPSPCPRINGGNTSYIINGQTGDIISKQLGQ